jgi:hypothetical protein
MRLGECELNPCSTKGCSENWLPEGNGCRSSVSSAAVELRRWRVTATAYGNRL